MNKNSKVKKQCHCEERSDEAIPHRSVASLRAPPKHRGTKQSLWMS